MNELYPKIELQDMRMPQRYLFGIKVRVWLVLASFLGTLCFFLFQGGKLSFMVFIIVSVLCIYLGLGQWSGIRKSKGVRTLVPLGMNPLWKLALRLESRLSWIFLAFGRFPMY